jgi:hypothetical protein
MSRAPCDLEVAALVGAVRAAGCAIGIDGDGYLTLILPGTLSQSVRDIFIKAIEARCERVIDFLATAEDEKPK